jgi:hypothetical protein
MARIRSIKPEFPHSESMGRVSRDARLTFILLWTIADDSGRLRGNSRMLASLLFPYDGDAPKAIDKWLSELEGEKCVVRYKVNGDSYLEIRNWLTHQKIDKPSKSKIVPFANIREDSRDGREGSSWDQRSGSKDQGEEGIGEGEDRTVATVDLAAEFLLAWNHTTGATPIRKMTDKRSASLRVRLADPDWDWRAALAKFPLRCFASDPNGYVPDVEFFLKPDTVTKILEGKYDWTKNGKALFDPDDPTGNMAVARRYLEARNGEDD